MSGPIDPYAGMAQGDPQPASPTPSDSGKRKKKSRFGGRLGRTLKSLAVISALGIGLAAFNTITLRNDVATATSTRVSDGQKRWLIDAADRPDIAVFFKGLRPEERLAMAENIGRYDDPKLPALAAKLLGDFDEAARKVLTESLTKLAKTQPSAVAEQFKVKGSFQNMGVATALRSIGSEAYAPVAAMLENGDARPAAVAFLTESGPSATSAVLPLLKSENKDVRLAAADVLGKLRATEAIPDLVRLYETAEPADRAQYLAALSGIGSPRQVPLFTGILNDAEEPPALRATAALGLGRADTPDSVATLWRYTDSDDLALREAVINGLQVATNNALRVPRPLTDAVVRVAGAIRTPTARDLLAQALSRPDLRDTALAAATDRADLAPLVVAALGKANPATEGGFIDRAIRTLLTTAEGEAALASLATREELRGFITRRTGTS